MTEEERRLEARKRIAKARQKQALQFSGENDLLPPRADDPSYLGEVTPNPQNNNTNFRTEFSQPGVELMSQAYYDGVVDVPDQMPLYYDEGFKIKFAPAIQKALEFVGDVGVFGLGAVEAGAGYTVGAVADIMVSAGVDPSTANRFAREVMSMPDAFAGSPSQLIRGGKRIATSKIDQTVKTLTEKEQKAIKELDPPPKKYYESKNLESNEVSLLSGEEVGTLLRTASSGGPKSQKAIEILAQQAQTNPSIVAAAKRLGINLPVDVSSDNPLMKSAASLTRDVKGSQAALEFESIVLDAAARADEIMSSLGGSTDLASISQKVFDSITTTRTALKNSAGKLYKIVDAKIPAGTKIQVNNSVILLNKLIEEAGGVAGLASKEKKLFDKITNPDVPLTYSTLKKFKNSIGRGIRTGDGEYGDLDQGTLKRIYGALAEDQLLSAENIGGEALRSTLRLANQATEKQKAFEKRITSSFGKDLDGSIANKLRQSIDSGSKGDISGLNRILKIIPKDLQREALATALNVISMPKGAIDIAFGFAEFAKTVKGLKQNKPVYKRIVDIMGPDSKGILDDLFNVSERLTEARGRVSQTGKANQSLIAGTLTADSLATRIFNKVSGPFGSRVVQGASVAAGAPGANVALNLVGDLLLSGKKEILANAGNLLNSGAFKSLVNADQFALQSALDKIEKSPAFKRWLKSVEMEPAAGRNFLQTSIVIGGESGVVPEPVVEEPVVEEEIDVSNSSALQSLIKNTDPSLLNGIN